MTDKVLDALGVISGHAESFITHWIDDDDPEDHARAVDAAAEVDDAEATVKNALQAADKLREALCGLHSQIVSARAHPRWAHLSNEQTNMLSAYMLKASKAIAAADAAGIGQKP